MKELLLVRLAPGVAGGRMCQECGLEYPHQNYHFLAAACPRCASREWAHLVLDYAGGWKRLGGNVGGPRGRKRPPWPG
jgi:hypothetical protein